MIAAAVSSIEGRPAVAGAQLARLSDLGGYSIAIDIVLEMAMRLLYDAILADLRDALSGRDQRHHEGARRHFELWRQRNAGNQRHVRRLESPIGEVDRGRRL